MAGGQMKELLQRLDRDESGAVLMMCLGAILICLMVAMTIYDVGVSARDKVMLQASADTAALSHASVEARAMNLTAYANVAKRTVVGIHTMYQGQYLSYRMWYLRKDYDCRQGDLSACSIRVANDPLYWRETKNDYLVYSGDWEVGWENGDLGVGGNSVGYHAIDVRALDNYQRYMIELSPWWGFSEATFRGMRNGATAVSNFPAPKGYPQTTDISQATNMHLAMSNIGSDWPFELAPMDDELPWKKGSWWGDLYVNAMMRNDNYRAQHQKWAEMHQRLSELGAAEDRVVRLGSSYYFERAFSWTILAFGDAGRPYILDVPSSEAEWLARTSTLVFAYGHDEMRGDLGNKYDMVDKDYQMDTADQATFETTGAWSIARAEYFTPDGLPDAYQSTWTARMRPVSLPDEWRDVGFDMSHAFHSALPYMTLSAQIGAGSSRSVRDGVPDMATMERTMRAFGPSTANGMTK